MLLDVSVRLPASVLHLWLVAEGKLKLSLDNGASAENIKSFVIDYKEQMPNDAPELKSFEDDFALRRLTLASEIVQIFNNDRHRGSSRSRPPDRTSFTQRRLSPEPHGRCSRIVTAGAVCLAWRETSTPRTGQLTTEIQRVRGTVCKGGHADNTISQHCDPFYEYCIIVISP